jgi:hypothetical protein
MVEQKNTTEEVNTEQKRDYDGDKGVVELEFERNTPIEAKPIPSLSYGHRVLIAKLHQDHEPYMDHIIQCCGWARSVRAGGKSESGVGIFFIELYDGSTPKVLQCVVDSTMPNFEEVSACKPGSSFKIMGKLIKSPMPGQEFEL